MRGIKLLGVLLLVLAAAPLVSAQFTTQLVTVDEVILPGQPAQFEVHVTNYASVEDRYTLQSPEYSYILFLEDRPPRVQPNQTGVYTIEIQPRSFVNYGTHKVPIEVRSQETGERTTLNPIIFVQDPDRPVGVYTPSIALAVGAPDVVDPREDLQLSVHLRNRNARTYEGDESLTVRISSDIFFHEYQTSLGGVGANGEKSTERTIEIDDHQPAGVHPLSVEVLVGNQTVSQRQSEFTIQEYADVVRDVARDSSFFKTTTTYHLTNDGNVETVAEVAYPASVFSQLFISSTHNYDSREVDGQRSLVVSESLDSQEQVVVTVTENYRLLALLILLAIASVIGYYALRSPLVLGKEAQLSGDVEEGKSEIKVRLFLKNRSAQTLRNLRVIDRISGMAEVQKDDSLGTLKPTKVVKKKGQGTLLRWDLDALEPFEERIITYRVHTPLTLVGDVTLPNMKVKFDASSGRERTTHSNEVSVARYEE